MRGPAKTEAFERDPDALELLHDFLSETTDGLAEADESLIALGKQYDLERLHSVFRAFHSMKGFAGFLDLDDIARVSHITESALNEVRNGALPLAGPILEAVLDATGMTRLLLDEVRRAIVTRTHFARHPGVPALVARIEAAIATATLEASTTAAVAGPTGPRATPTRAADTKLHETIKVDVDHVDALVDLVGEMLVAQAMVVGAPELAGVRHGQLDAALSELTRISAGLQDAALRMRMIALRSLFQRLTRVVHELARRTGKAIHLEAVGDTTKMDRHMVEKIEDALVHLLRNAADHGIEPLDERRRSGKSDAGTIHVRAFPSDGAVIVEVEDDGRGLDPERLLAKAVERNLVRAGERPSEAEIFRLIFAPGFTTATVVTDISGRGVGMDVVKRNIEAMRGQVHVTSKLGSGTTVRIQLPLTLALQDGMQVTSAGETYVVPTIGIEESLELDARDVSTLAGDQRFVSVRGALVPLYPLSQVLDVEDSVPERAEGAPDQTIRPLALIVRSGARRVAFIVDDIANPQQYVVKHIDPRLGTHRFVGATILPNGRVALILNVDGLANRTHTARPAPSEMHT